MKRILLIVILFLSAGCSTTRYQALIGQPAPESRFYMTSGDTLPVSAFKGKTTVVVFWAAWCPKSKQLLRKLDEYVQQHDPLGVEYVLVSIDKQDDYQKVQAVLTTLHSKKLKLAFSGNEYYDEAYLAFKGEEVPLVIMIDRQGKVVAGGHDFSVVEENLRFALPAH